MYRKYRPQTFSQVVGQEHITATLKNQLAEGKSVHAYLFTGTRGTGKTSCAKILARAVNCLNNKTGDPCLECEACLSIERGEATDIVEIDAASNNGVDDIRQLRELLNFTPTSSKYRVFIIDEVHMLSIGAFNALLKTLEEPPEHVVFILATTEVHKLPATILSRCQRYDFRRIDSEKICERIQYIAQKEGITVSAAAATLIASAADGGMRDALSILDLCASVSRDIDESTVESVCAMAGNHYLLEMADCIKKRDCERALTLIDSLHNSSVDMLRLLAELTGHYRDLMIVKTVNGKSRPIVCSSARMEALEKQAEDYDLKDIMYCISKLQEAFASMQNGNRRCELEMTIIKICNPALSFDFDALERRVSALEKSAAVRTVIAETPKVAADSTEATNSVEQFETNEAEPSNNEAYNSDSPIAEWDDILDIIKTESPLFAGVLVGSKAYIDGVYLLIDAPNSQFRTMINSEKGQYKDSIRKAAQQILGKTYKLGPYTKKVEASEEDPLVALAKKVKNFEIN